MIQKTLIKKVANARNAFESQPGKNFFHMIFLFALTWISVNCMGRSSWISHLRELVSCFDIRLRLRVFLNHTIQMMSCAFKISQGETGKTDL